jgi:methylated-DNA-[protein]-cysteine S-methyltransferase
MSHLLDSLYLPGPTPEQIAHAQHVVRQALAALNTTITYAPLADTPLGLLWIAASGRGLVALRFGDAPEAERALITDLQKRGAVQRNPAALAEAERQLRDYLRGERALFDVPVDLSALTEFQRNVLLAASAVPRGQVVTYGEIALRLGKPQAARAVGQALRRNPLPIIIPCHRVLGTDGALRGYLGRAGVQTKARLLRLEGVPGF